MAKNGDQPMFSEEERKEHKKQQLLNSSLGALLSGIGDGDNVDRSSSSTQKTKTAGHDREGETKRAEVADNCGLNKKTSALDFVEMKLEDWTQTRQFNDNYANDIEYLTYERQKLAEKYGEGIIDVNCSQQGTFSYYCK
ncbi:hypothetical protein SK128_024438 [Halocaridina rubra]|uniref:Uncharacterized protein n=1 Tax=Halocaridina rubra TaxID=373956 RepID=A0AAN8ZZ73_HALRR